MAMPRGHESHRVGMSPRYVDAVLEGGLVPSASVQTVLDAGALRRLSGQRGYGQGIGEQAMALGCTAAASWRWPSRTTWGVSGRFAEMTVAGGQDTRCPQPGQDG